MEIIKELITIKRSDLIYIYKTCKSLGAQVQRNIEYKESTEKTIDFMKKTIEDLKEELKKKLTEEDISQMVEEVRFLSDKFCSININKG